MKKSNVLLQLLLIALLAASCWWGGFWGGFVTAMLFSCLVLINTGLYLEWRARKQLAAKIKSSMDL